MAALQAGTTAPDFSLQATPDQAVSLHEFRGQRVILAFYPADWSPVCGDELALFNEMLPEFRRLGAELLGISVDGIWCHLAFARARSLRFPLLSDFEPKGKVSRVYGAYHASAGTSERVRFVFGHIPLANVHPHAELAAETAEAAGRLIEIERQPLIEGDHSWQVLQRGS